MNSKARFGELRAGAMLIVDDDEHMRELLASLARSLGFSRFIQASGAAGAIAKLDHNSISAALIDLCLDDGDGVEIIAAIRGHRREFIRRTPIVALSTTATHARVVEAMLAGADTFMSKPITVGKFEKHLWVATNKPRPLQMPIAAAAQRIAPPAASFEID